MKSEGDQKNIALSDEEKKRLVAYFNVLIEMDFALKKVNEEQKYGELGIRRSRKG